MTAANRRISESSIFCISKQVRALNAVTGFRRTQKKGREANSSFSDCVRTSVSQQGDEKYCTPRKSWRTINPGLFRGRTSDFILLMPKETIKNVQCPACDSNAVYRDGRSRTGKQRYLCLLCGMQFVNNHRTRIKKRPLCAACGSSMHLYRHEPMFLRFRCSRYPDCRTYMKVPKGDATNG